MEKTRGKAEGKEGGLVDSLFSVGAHFAFVKSRRHPSAKPFIFGSKNNIEIFDLEKTSLELEKALAFVEEKGREGAIGLWVGGKSEAREAVKLAGLELDMPFVPGRWIGGTISNFAEIKKRIMKLEELTGQRERGELGKYTKKERLLIDREIERLNIYFGGLSNLKALPKFVIVFDPKKEHIAVAEAKRMNIPVVALAGSDSDLTSVDYAIPGNDASRQSIGFVAKQMVTAYRKGREAGMREKETKE